MQGAAAELGYKEKAKEYEDWALPAKELLPFVVETGGYMHPAARSYLHGFIKDAHSDVREFSKAWTRATQLLSVALQRCSARRINTLARQFPLAPLTG